LTRWQRILADYPAAKALWDRNEKERIADFQKRVKEAALAGKVSPIPPFPPEGPDDIHRPCCFWNGMLRPLTRFPIKGAIWYQGESNAGNAAEYAKLFPAMIKDWRAQWGVGDFPFYFVQLPNFGAFKQPVPYPAESNWAELREAQDHSRYVPNTGMAVTIDLGEADQIHPRNKRPVGERLALLALKNVYEQDTPCEGPSVSGSRRVPGGVEITFKNVARHLATGSGVPLRYFAVSGTDGKFVWAQAAITGTDGVLVKTPPGTTNIASIRYNWGDSPNGNLYNGAGLPAEPFRIDCKTVPSGP
jgi:sialate O-acetylesterase